jgi:hypothetical protein
MSTLAAADSSCKAAITREVTAELRSNISRRLPLVFSEINQTLQSLQQPLPVATQKIHETMAELTALLEMPNSTNADRSIVSDYLTCLDFPVYVHIQAVNLNPMEQLIPYRAEETLDVHVSRIIDLYRSEWRKMDYGIGRDPLMSNDFKFSSGLFSFRSWLNNFADGTELVGVPEQSKNSIDSLTFELGRSLSLHDMTHAHSIRAADLAAAEQLSISPSEQSVFTEWRRREIAQILKEIDLSTSQSDRKWREAALFYLIHEIYLSLPLHARNLIDGSGVQYMQFGKEIRYTSIDQVISQMTAIYYYHHDKTLSIEDHRNLAAAGRWIIENMARNRYLPPAQLLNRSSQLNHSNQTNHS